MAFVRGIVKSAKEHEGMVCLHISSRHGIGWLALSKEIFARAYQKRLIKQMYGKSNRRVERDIRRLEHEIKLLKKEKGKEHLAKQREYEIYSLKGKIKKELHMHDLEGKRIYLRMY